MTDETKHISYGRRWRNYETTTIALGVAAIVGAAYLAIVFPPFIQEVRAQSHVTDAQLAQMKNASAQNLGQRNIHVGIDSQLEDKAN